VPVGKCGGDSRPKAKKGGKEGGNRKMKIRKWGGGIPPTNRLSQKKNKKGSDENKKRGREKKFELKTITM